MTIQWTVAAQAAGCGIVGVILVIAVRAFKKMRPLIIQLHLLGVFLGCALVPSIPVFIIYPFVEPKPSLEEHAAFMIPAAGALAWAVYEAIRQGLTPSTDPARSKAPEQSPPSSPESS